METGIISNAKKEFFDGVKAGGEILAIRLNEDEKGGTILSRKSTLGSHPSWGCVDKTGRYLLVTNHGSRNHSVHVAKNMEGKWDAVPVFDEAALAVFPIEEDGSLGDAVDYCITKDENSPVRCSRQHSVAESPRDNLFVVCDKGLDEIHAFSLNRTTGKLIYKNSLSLEKNCAPRYGVFHPVTGLFYANMENQPLIYAFAVNEECGIKKIFQILDLSQWIDKEGGGCPKASDLKLNEKENCLYAAYREANVIAVIRLSEEGVMSVKQIADCCGEGPRGLCIAPDSKYLLAAGMENGTVSRYKINDDGTLNYDGVHAEGACPAVIHFMD